MQNLNNVKQIKQHIATNYPSLAIIPLNPFMSGNDDMLYAITFRAAEHNERTYANTRAVISVSTGSSIRDPNNSLRIIGYNESFGLLQNNYCIIDGSIEESAQVGIDDVEFLDEILTLCADESLDAYELAGTYCGY